ncbi:hypothetical protein [Enhygromyxa salina]|nr:hypothetical protein [Enhygromyxa salina]
MVMLREAVSTDEGDLRTQLDFARRAVENAAQRRVRDDAKSVNLAESVLSLVSGLCLTLNLQHRDFRSAQRRLDEVKRELFALIVVGPASTRRVELRPSSWWSRLVSRGANGDITLLN